MKNYKYILIFGFLLISSQTFSQISTYSGSTFVLNSNNHGNKEYLAEETITLSDGFQVNASTDGKFRAAIQAHVIPAQPESEAVNYEKTEIAAISGLSNRSALITASEGVQKHTIIGFMDGEGKTIQSQALKSTNDAGSSIVQPFEYDAYGRQIKQYLAYPEDGSITSYDAAAITNQTSFYSTGTSGLESDNKPFSIPNFDDSPYSRLLSNTPPGSEWHNNNKDKDFDIGIDNSGAIRRWSIGGSGTPVTTTTYPAKYLSYSEITNEEGRTIRNYVDPLGNLILNESIGTDASVYRTYYAYDVFNNLLSVIPPVAVKLASASGWNLTVADANDLCFIYTYDEQNRLVESKNPGVAPIYFVYDSWHRPVLSQDGNQRNASPDEWTFVKYDAFDRPIAVGIYKSNSSRATLATTVLGAGYGHHESTNTSLVGYTLNASFPSTVTELDLLQLTYYDNYDFLGNPRWDDEGHNYTYAAPAGFTGSASNAVLDLVTGSKVRVLGTSTWLNAVVRYDEKYRILQVVKENHLGGVDKTSVLYNDFKGTVQKTHFDHSSSGDSFTMLETYDYDNNDRVLNKWRKVGTGATVLVENYQYNKLGQIIERNIHSTDNGVSFLQSVDFTYNVRGWLTGINNSDLSSNTDANALDDLFGISLNFATTGIQVNTQTVTPKYDGSISSVSWKNQNPDKTDKEHIYGYDYDAQGRIIDADYATKSSGTWTGDAGMYDTQYTYEDENGNIKTIKRNAEKAGVLTDIDNIVLDYINNGNQLEDVSDTQSSTGFNDAVTMTTEFTYDDNGNMTSDLNAEITDITYNIFNLPEKITVGKASGDIYINNKYDALGNKLRMEVEENSNIVMSIDYTNGVHYVDGQLAYVRTSEGRILRYGSNYEHEYALTDHQGNIRSTFGMLHDTDVYYATMETERATEEQADFINMTTNFVSLYNHTEATIELPNPDRSKYITPGSSGGIGPAIAIPVNSGDKISAEIFALFDNSNSSNNTSAPAGILEAVASSFGTTSGEALYGQFSNAISSLVSGWSNTSNVTPDAYLNLIWVNTANTANSFAYDKVEPTAYTSYEPLNVEFTAPGVGTVFIYVANESDLSTTDLFLDDFLVVHEKTTSSLNIVSTANYYPFGMKMDAESYDHLTREKQRHGYNGNEEIDGGGLTLMDFNARIYNPSLGRFMGADALASVSAASSPYAFTSNDPINLIDPTGLTSREWGGSFRKHFLANFGYEGSFARNQRIWGAGRTGPGSGNHWSDGIYYSDWTLHGGSPTYRLGLSMGLIDIGGILYSRHVNADGSRNRFDTRHGQQGFYKQTNSGEPGLPSIEIIDGVPIEVLAGITASLEFVPLQSSGRNDGLGLSYSEGVNQGLTVLGFANDAANTAGEVTSFHVVKGLQKVTTRQAVGLSKFTKGTGIAGAVLAGAVAGYEYSTGKFDSHSVADLTVAGAAVILGGVAVIIGSPLLLTGVAVGGLIYGVASALGSDWFDDYTNHWGRDLVYGPKGGK
ncbi:DUF6443 domain-containing protein [Fulvivirgaceae bacterium BMA12]|uniref:DUF6443 domain-containing protein n=1 Tax=Agaribacillus aureus TaxID=3051825 RepID=A0ABT8LF85_9BACT|nr:DUF6443 domain-containing protein [Fulvivirgaceae bacterium BMA12]